jgi:catechol 2,3-dioxygenase-like lactoylglutathione lyase family enzyme
MLDHIAIEVSDVARSKAFYTAALAPLGYTIIKQPGAMVIFGVADGPRKSPDPAGEFSIAPGTPHADVVHVAFNAGSRAEVDAFHRSALAAGGTDNGAPGLRPKYHANYYGAFVLDPDGYNVEAVCHAADGG